MPDRRSEPPVLEYHSPRPLAEYSLATRVTFGVFASIMTLIAAVFVAASVADAMEGMWSRSWLFLIPACLAYVLWQPVGLRVRSRERPKS